MKNPVVLFLYFATLSAYAQTEPPVAKPCGLICRVRRRPLRLCSVSTLPLVFSAWWRQSKFLSLLQTMKKVGFKFTRSVGGGLPGHGVFEEDPHVFLSAHLQH